MRGSILFLSATALLASGASAQTARPGPKVHVSEAKDTSDCKNTSGGLATAGGGAAGALVGSKVIGGSYGIMGGMAAGSLAADHVSKKAKCKPKATVENGDEEQPAPKAKTKGKSLGALRGALGL